jgi:type II secretory pathway component PulF
MDSLLNYWPILILLGIVLRMALRLVYGARGPTPSDLWYLFLNVLSWLLLAVGMAPAILFCGMTILGLVLILLAAMAIVEAIVERRAMHRRSTCAMLALLMERKTPLEPSLLLEGQYGRGVVSRASRALLAELRRGTPLSVAIERHPEALPREAVAYAAVGDVVGAEVESLKELGAADDSQLALLRRTCIDRITYLTSILALMTLVAFFMMVKIIPEYQKIFQEFEMELPSMTWFVVSVSAFFVDYLAVPFILLIMLGGLTAIIVAILYMCDVPVLQPVTDRMMRAKRVADVLRMLAVATEHRQSLSDVFGRLAQVYPTAFIRRQLQRVASFVAAGDEWRNALLDARFVSEAEYALLKTADEVHNLPWALRTISRRKERRLVYRWTAAVQVAYPCVILLIGLGIGVFSAAMFLPLVKLIEGLGG